MKLTGKDAEGHGCGLIYGTIQSLASGDRGKSQKKNLSQDS
jgi:hypothetical protein